MALHTVAEFKNSVAGILSGTDLSLVDDLNGALERAASVLLQKADVPEASHIQNITLYSGVFNYPCDSRIYGSAITDIRPQGISRNPSDYVVKKDQADFDRNKNYYSSGTMSTFEYYNGTPIIRIVAPFPKQQIILDSMSSTFGWVAGGTASNLNQDVTDFYQSPASLRFDISTGIGTLAKTLQSPDSMANYQGVGVAFLAIQIPSNATASDVTSIKLQLGSDSLNYDEVTATQGFLGTWVSGEWLLVGFDFSGATTTGSPNWSSIQYIQILITVANSVTNFRVGGLFMSLPTPAQILFQSVAIFLPTGSNTALTTITSNSDQIILGNPSYNIYQYEGALAILENMGGNASDSSIARIEARLNGARARNGVILSLGLYDLYRGDNPSQEIRQTGSYYDTNMPYSNYW